MLELYGLGAAGSYQCASGAHVQCPSRFCRCSCHPEATQRELVSALEGVLGLYVSIANSGDAGNWDVENEAQVKAARAVLAKIK